MIAVEVKGRDVKFTREIIGAYRAPNEHMRVIEGLTTRTDCLGKSTKRSVIGGDLSLPYAEWKGNMDDISRGQTFTNRLVWENGYAEVVNGATRTDALLDVYLIRPQNFG
jgi:hypothetical protein